MATTTEPPWLHKSSGVAARNGTTGHTIDPTTFGDAPFTPTAGSLLAVFVFGAVTNTASGTWTEQLQPVNSAELSLFTKAAVGGDTLVLTHNGSNYPVNVMIIELPAGSSYVTGNGTTPSADTFTNLTGIGPGGTGNERLVFAARGRAAGSTASAGASSVWTTPYVEDMDLHTAFATTDGVYLTIAHAINVTSTSADPTANVTTTYLASDGAWVNPDREHIVAAFIAAPVSAGGTPFTRDYSTNWRVYGGFTADYATTWRVFASFTRDYSTTWRVLNALTRDYATTWRVYTAITRDYGTSWNVLATFTRDYATSWNVLGGFTRDYSTSWRVFNAWNTDVATTWRVYGSFTRDYATTWRIYNGFAADTASTWRVYNVFARDYATSWDVLALGTWQRDYATSWRVFNGLAKDYASSWRVYGTFARDYSSSWDVLPDTSFARTYATAWRVYAALTREYVTTWRILSANPPLPLPADVVVRLDELAMADLSAEQTFVYLD